MHVFQNYFQTVLMNLLHGFSYVDLLIKIFIFILVVLINLSIYLFLTFFCNFFIYLKLAYIQPARAAFCTHPFARAAFYIHAPFCKGFLLHALSQGLALLQGLPLLAIKPFCKGSLWMLTLSQGLKGPRVKGNCSPAPVSFARLPLCQSCPFARTS